MKPRALCSAPLESRSPVRSAPPPRVAVGCSVDVFFFGEPGTQIQHVYRQMDAPPHRPLDSPALFPEHGH